jgi:hypothetical protein
MQTAARQMSVDRDGVNPLEGGRPVKHAKSRQPSA